MISGRKSRFYDDDLCRARYTRPAESIRLGLIMMEKKKKRKVDSNCYLLVALPSSIVRTCVAKLKGHFPDIGTMYSITIPSTSPHSRVSLSAVQPRLVCLRVIRTCH